MASKKIQVRLRRFLLIFATCAVWIAYWGNEFQRSNANAKLIQTLKSSRSLDVQDTSRIGVKATSFQSSTNWSLDTKSNKVNGYQSLQCFVPDSGWEICIATRDLPAEGYPKTCETAPICKGTWEIELTLTTIAGGTQIKVQIEGKPTFDVREDEAWINGGNLLPRVRAPTNKLQMKAIAPTELTRITLASIETKDKKTPAKDNQAPTNGVLIWFRKIGDSR